MFFFYLILTKIIVLKKYFTSQTSNVNKITHISEALSGDVRTKCWKAAAAAFVGDSKPATEFFFFKVTFIFSIEFFIKLTGRTWREGERMVWLEVFQARGNDMGEDAGGETSPVCLGGSEWQTVGRRGIEQRGR